MTGRVVDRGVLAGPTLEAARALLGARLVRDGPQGRTSGRIVEVEAYIGEADLASHARFGRTARNDVMYGRPGLAYLYLVYGMHVCLNVVTEPEGRPAAILVRAVELVTGLELARAARLEHRVLTRRRPLDPPARAREAARIAALPAERIAAGPGLVGAAFGLGTELTGLDLCDPRSGLRLEPAPTGELRPPIRATPRIGIAYAGPPWTEVPWRLLLDGHPSVSGPVRGG